MASEYENAMISQSVASNGESEKIPEFARIALVPVANPETAPHLLRLAGALTHPTEGKIIALLVSLGDAEADAKSIKAIEEVVAQVTSDGFNCKIETEVALSVSRGILDSARELGADLLIMGIQAPRRGEVKLGAVVEGILQAAPCDVLIYRAAANMEFSRVIIPVTNIFHSPVAARVGIRLAQSYDVKIEAIHPQGSRESQYEGLAKIETVLDELPGHRAVKRTVVNADNEVEAILTRAQDDDLMVVGFNERNELEQWMFGDLSKGILNNAPGPVVMVSRTIVREDKASRLWRRAITWLQPTLTEVEQDEIVRQAREMTSFNIDFAVLIVVSATLATLGLLLNSPAVIIGAMLVAPLMSPLIGLSTGLAVGRVYMGRQALTTLLNGVALALLVAIGIGLILPTDLPTAEMLARGKPTLVDAAVAFASGVIGAYATARKDIPAALAGVAIAAALMPPLCTVGLGIAFRDADLAFGATVLFLTNIVNIITAGVVVFLWLGMRFHRYEGVALWKQVVAVVMLVVSVALVGGELAELTRQAGDQSLITEQLKDAFDAVRSVELVELETYDESPLRVLATVRSSNEITNEIIADLQTRIENRLGEPVKLELVALQVITAAPVEAIQLPEATEESEN